jgi:hypothetical protein
VKTWGESRLENEWQMISRHLDRIREELGATRRRIEHDAPLGRSDAGVELQQLEDRLAAYLEEEQAISGRLDGVRDDRERREAEARPRLVEARSAYDAAVVLLEAGAAQLAELRATAAVAARFLLAAKEAAGAGGVDAPIPTRITIWKNADPGQGRDYLIEWRR